MASYPLESLDWKSEVLTSLFHTDSPSVFLVPLQGRVFIT